MTTTSTSLRPTTVLGLGPMGTALARALLRAGLPTTVWNRNPQRATVLASKGATAAPDPTAAVTASDLVLVCLRDHDAVWEVLDALDPGVFAGRTVVNLTTSTPDQGRRTASWAAQRGMTYLSGAIMVPTDLIGEPAALILYSGDRAVFDRTVARLRHLAGTADYLGDDPGAAALYDMAMLEIFFAGMTAFLHAAAMTTAQGVEAKTFLPYAQQIAALLRATFTGLAHDVDDGSYPGTQDNLAMEVSGLEHILDTSTEIGLDSRLPRALRDLAREARDAGYGTDGFSRVVEILRAGHGAG